MSEEKSKYHQELECMEKELFERVLKESRYNQSKTARILGISRGTLRTKLAKYFGDTYVGNRNSV